MEILLNRTSHDALVMEVVPGQEHMAGGTFAGLFLFRHGSLQEQEENLQLD